MRFRATCLSHACGLRQVSNGHTIEGMTQPTVSLDLPQLPAGPPTSRQELLQRARQLAGLPLGCLAAQAGWQVPATTTQAKGWAGQLIETFLGATAGSKPEQDFPELGVELKTIPLRPDGTPLETTYVCIAPLMGLNGVSWEQSNVRNKLSCVLWVPVDGRRTTPLVERAVGWPVLWQPTAQQEAQLKADWEELTEAIVLGEVEQLTARHGVALQLRPKAANSKALTPAIGPAGQLIQTLPRGYYLKKSYTANILRQATLNPEPVSGV